jgi:hypothetical protein
MKNPALLIAIAAIIIAAWSRLPRADEKPAAKTLEYYVLTNKSGTVDTANTLKAILVANTKERWEFCDCIKTKDSDLLVFKRSKE